MTDVLTLTKAIADGATAIVGSVVTVVSKIVVDPTFLTLIGLAIGYGVVKFVLNMLPMIKSR
ncbi:MAG: hypothetical protein RR290_02345 [Clostridia bacterium]